MSTATVARISHEHPSPHDGLLDELDHIRDLVFLRSLLAERGAPAWELQECDAVIDEARRRLAESARRASSRYAAAAA